MRTFHRVLAVFAVLFALYIGTTGVLTQLIDLQAILRHAPAGDPTMQAIRVGMSGPPNFQVIRDPDYSARSLPANFDFDAGLGALVKAERAALGEAPLSYLELRMGGDRPVGRVASKGQAYSFDLAKGTQLGGPSPVTPAQMEQPSLRNSMKSVHRMFGGWNYAIDLTAGLTLCAMIFTGLVQYFQLIRARQRMGRGAAPFWLAGGWWRSLHRGVAIAAGLFLSVVVLSGSFLAFNALAIVTNKAIHKGARPGMTADVSSPLAYEQLPPMMHATLAAYRSGRPEASIRVLRLRYFSGMPQGVVVTGDPDARQVVFNTSTGRQASQSEPGYPETGMPFGWQIGETIKRIHRGDAFGLTGRFIAVLSGLSLLYLCLSGALVYVDLWKKRRKAGRRGLFWT